MRSWAGAAILLSMTQFASAAVMLNEGLLAWYQFEDNTLDSSSSANHGTAYGGLSYVDGVYGQAARFNESLSTYVLTQYDIPLNSPSYAVSTWFRVSSYTGVWEILVSRMKDPATSWDDAWDLSIASDTGLPIYWFNTTAQGTNAVVGGVQVPTSEWHSMIVNVDNGAGAVFLDGILIASFSQIGTLNSEGDIPVCIGCNDYNPGFSKHYLNGDLDDLRMYGRSLNADEIAALSDASYSVTEPGALALLGLGLAALLATRRKFAWGRLTMGKSLLATAATAISLFAAPTQAFLIDNNTYTTDTESGLDWLDATRTQGLTYDQVLALLNAGQPLDGWRYATGAEFMALVSNATGVAISEPSSGYFLGAELGTEELDQLVSLLGPTLTDPDNLSLNVWGWIADTSPVDPAKRLLARLVDAIAPNLDFVQAYAVDVPNSYHSPGVGAFLVRDSNVVPEPATLALLALGAGGLAMTRRRQRVH